jgi:hypothetical protein
MAVGKNVGFHDYSLVNNSLDGKAATVDFGL